MYLRSGRFVFQEDWDNIVDYATKNADNHIPKSIMVEGEIYEDGLVGSAYLEIPRKEIKNHLVADGIEKKYITSNGIKYMFFYPYFSQSYEKNIVFMEAIKKRLNEYNIESNLIKYLD